MNALINSQEEEFNLGDNSPIRVARYTGQESLSQKSDIQNNPPHILLTNYVMLELMLSRVHEEKLVQSPVLKYLVLDELHTYRGRQGQDIPILCIGTSATMSTQGDLANRQTTVASVASKLFGVEVKASSVIDETLEPAITRPHPTTKELTESINTGLPAEKQQTSEAFLQHPLSSWIEINFGLAEEDGHLVRKTPIVLSQGSEELSKVTGIDKNICSDTLKQMFFWRSRVEI